MFLFFLSAKGGGVSHSNNIILFRRKNYNSEILTLNSVVEGEQVKILLQHEIYSIVFHRFISQKRRLSISINNIMILETLYFKIGNKHPEFVIIMKLRKSRLKTAINIDRIEMERCSQFQNQAKTITAIQRDPPSLLATNFHITVNHPYIFIILHLKTNGHNKNILNISIPEICVFHHHQPYDLLYCENGHIRGMKDYEPVKLHKIYNFFSNRTKLRSIPKQEQCVACFQKQQYQLLSDTDLFIACRKFKSDPFFNKIIYIRNRLDIVESNIVVEFDGSKDCEFAGQVIESFLGFKSESQMKLKYGRQGYLRFLSEKITLFLNIEHNIRIKRAKLIFSKTVNDHYFFTDVTQLSFQNLTEALQRREQKLKQLEQSRFQRLVMSEQQYQRVKHKQSNPQVNQIEQEMNSIFYQTVKRFSIQTHHQNEVQSKNNQLAFNKLFPKYSTRMWKTLTVMDIKDIRKKVLQTEPTEQSKKGRPSRRMYLSRQKAFN